MHKNIQTIHTTIYRSKLISKILRCYTLRVLFNVLPSYEDVKAFGCLFCAHIHCRGWDKFHARATKRIFVGYPHGQKDWKAFELETCKVSSSRGVGILWECFCYLPKLIPMLNHPSCWTLNKELFMKKL